MIILKDDNVKSVTVVSAVCCDEINVTYNTETFFRQKLYLIGVWSCLAYTQSA